MNILVVLISAGAALFFLYRLVMLYRFNRRIQASQAWPQAAGRVTEAHVLSTVSSSRSGGRSRHYYGEISYAYDVLGSAFAGKFKKDKFFTSQQWAEQVVAAYPAGTAVQVRYNPDRPQEAVTAEDQVRTSEVVLSVILFLLMAAWTVFYLVVGL